MSDDDETTDSNDVTPASESAATSDNGERHTVHIPQWLAGTLVVVLALVIGAVGYTLGASSNDDDGPSFRPINASQQGGQQGGQGGGFPGGPGGHGGPGGQQGGPGGGPSFDDRGERGDGQGEDDQDSQDSQDDDSNTENQDEDANF